MGLSTRDSRNSDTGTVYTHSVAISSIESLESAVTVNVDRSSNFRSVVRNVGQLRVLLRRHRLQWKDLDTLRSLNWDSFPWPVFRKLTRIEDLKKEEVVEYLHFLRHFEGNEYTAEEHIREHIRLWHPDRLEARILERIDENDRERVRVCANEVSRILGQIQVSGTNLL
jgi:hypothetical protein